MITEENYKDYFRNLAKLHKQILHEVNGRDAFFYVPAEYDLREIDNALRSGVSTPLLMLDNSHGKLNSNGSASNHQDINVQFTILEYVETSDAEGIGPARDKCLPVGLDILARMQRDKGLKLLLHPSAAYTLDEIPYDPVGPMAMNYYGYTFRALIRCPFVYSVDGGTWSDIPAT